METISGTTPGGMSTIPQGGMTALPPTDRGPYPSPQEEPLEVPTTNISEPVSQPSTSPTVISTDSMREQLDGAQKTLEAMKAQIEAGQQPIQQTAQPTIQPKTEAPKDPFQSEIDAYQKETTRILQQRKNDFNRYLSRSSDLLKSQVRSIQATFDVRENQAKDVANRAMAASQVLGARTGRMRYAPELQRGIITGQENDLISTLAEIDAMELAAIAAAEGAAYERDYTTFLDKIGDLDTIQKEREMKVDQLREIMVAENERREQAIEKTKQETAVIEQIALGTTDPITIFQNLEGEVPYDVIREYTETLPAPVSTEPVKLGSADLLVDPLTGRVIAQGSKVGGGSVSVGNAVGYGNSPVTVGSPTIQGLGATYETSSTEAQLIIDDIVNGLPTQLINNVAEIPRWRESVRKQLNAGFTAQEVIDKLSGFRLFEQADRNLGGVLYNMMTGTDLEPQALSTLLNRGADEQAMTTVENAQLSNAQGFFAGTDKARGTIKQAETVLNLLNDPSFPSHKLGAYDGRKFKVQRFSGMTNEEIIKVQQLESALQLLNAPIRVEIVGTAATEAEMSKITAFQADILDKPEIVKSIVTDLRDATLRFHNEARSQRGLPQVSREQAIDNKARLELYRSLGQEEQKASVSTLSNEELWGSMSSGGGMSSTNIWSTIGL